MPIIKVRNAVKRFGPVLAVDGVNLDINHRECFGLLGPNGAGKTSLVRMIIASSPVTEGEIWIDGKDIQKSAREIKARLGVVPQEVNLDPDLTVYENLIVFARYFSLPGAAARQRALDSLALFELLEKKDAKIEELSGGMKRRLLIARGLINHPSVLILDEPTVGLDPQTRHMVWQRLDLLKRQGVTLLLSTQNMDEARRLCDRVAIMNEGKIIALGSPQELLNRYGGNQVLEARPHSSERKGSILSRLSELGLDWQEIEDFVFIFQNDGQGLDDELKRELSIIDQHEANLEDVFLKLTGRSLNE
ncbi:MAG: ABC transporter ATP-binding protein [Dehalococcoidia bacterium]|nr:ABC transporter ATP-binding protein [Dehalococcoidia bacterium]